MLSAGRVVVLRDGRSEAIGPQRALLRSWRYARLVKHQMKELLAA